MQASQKFGLEQIAIFEVLFLVENTHPFNSARVVCVWLDWDKEMKEHGLALFPGCLVAYIVENERLQLGKFIIVSEWL